ncbi:MAG: hypothetical protein EBQ92_12875 [Proteobacteria bacterium]|nr:hypothetical protein [Pseudomonadota bacterium]
MGEGMGCNNLGLSFETGESVEKSFLKSKDLYTKACKTGEEEGCKNKWRLLSKTFSSPITYLALQERGTLFSSFLPTFGLYRFLLRVLYPELS